MLDYEHQPDAVSFSRTLFGSGSVGTYVRDLHALAAAVRGETALPVDYEAPPFLADGSSCCARPSTVDADCRGGRVAPGGCLQTHGQHEELPGSARQFWKLTAGPIRCLQLSLEGGRIFRPARAEPRAAGRSRQEITATDELVRLTR